MDKVSGDDRTPNTSASRLPIRSALKLQTHSEQDGPTDSPCRPSTDTARSHKKLKKGSSLVNIFAVKEPSRDAWAQYAEQQKKEAKVKGKAVVVGGVSSRKLPDHVPKVNSKWDGLPANAARPSKNPARPSTSTARPSKDGSPRFNKSRSSSRSASTTTSIRTIARTMEDPRDTQDSKMAAQIATQYPQMADPYQHQRNVSGSFSSAVTNMTTSLASDTESDSLSSDSEEPRVVSTMLSCLDVPSPTPSSSDGATDSPTIDSFSAPVDTANSSTTLSKYPQNHQSYIPRPIHPSGVIGAISAWPMPPRSNRASVESSKSATPPSIPRKSSSSWTDANLRPPAIQHKLVDANKAPEILRPPPLTPRNRGNATNPKTLPPAVRSFQAVLASTSDNDASPQPIAIQAKAPTWGKPKVRGGTSSRDVRTTASDALASTTIRATPQNAYSQQASSQTRPSMFQNLPQSPEPGPRPITPTAPPESISIPKGLPVRASPARNFARPFSPTNPPPEAKSGPNSPARASPRDRRHSRSPHRLPPKPPPGRAITDNSLPTIPESDATSILSVQLHSSTDEEGESQPQSVADPRATQGWSLTGKAGNMDGWI